MLNQLLLQSGLHRVAVPPFVWHSSASIRGQPWRVRCVSSVVNGCPWAFSGVLFRHLPHSLLACSFVENTWGKWVMSHLTSPCCTGCFYKETSFFSVPGNGLEAVDVRAKEQILFKSAGNSGWQAAHLLTASSWEKVLPWAGAVCGELGGGYRDPELQIDCLSGTGRCWAPRPPCWGESPFLRTSHPLFEIDKVFFFVSLSLTLPG